MASSTPIFLRLRRLFPAWSGGAAFAAGSGMDAELRRRMCEMRRVTKRAIYTLLALDVAMGAGTYYAWDREGVELLKSKIRMYELMAEKGGRH